MKRIKVRPITDFRMDEEDIKHFLACGDAMERGDDEAADRAIRKVKLSPPTLLATMRTMGVEAFRKAGYNTTLADQEFGPDWLDRDDIEWV